MTEPQFHDREIGRLVGRAAGPTVIAIGAIHGNEPAGVEAARRVLATLERRRDVVRGELVAFVGNFGAMNLGLRYQQRDLNRVWTAQRVASLFARHRDGATFDAEDREQFELLLAIRGAIGRARGPVHLVDLHTTSAHGYPFVLFGDTLRQRKFGGVIPLPFLLGLEENIEGVLSAYWTSQGCITCGVEGGQHDDPSSTDNLEAALLLATEAAGMLGTERLGEAEAAHAMLDRKRGRLPRVIEVVRRHAITPADEFVMEPGFANLARVRAGQLLARSRGTEVRAPHDGVVVLPLYQGQGSDGFFWGREMSAARMRLSETMRRLGAERFLSLLPGVRRDPKQSTRLVVDRRAAQIYRLETFHMLGFRRMSSDGDSLTNLSLERPAEAPHEASAS